LRKKAALTSEEKVKLVLSALEDKKAVDPTALDVRARTVMTDFFIIASGASRIHIKALADAVVEKLADNGIKNKRVEGYDDSAGPVWVLLDYGDVVVHVFAPDQRSFYKLESYWTGAEKGSPPPLSPEEVG